jgi:hypothetical protein
LSSQPIVQASQDPAFTSVIAPDPRFETRQVRSNGHRSLHAREAFRSGQILAEFTQSLPGQEPSYLTVQVGEFEHVRLAPSHLELINHSCEPNVFFDVDKFQIQALKDIAKGEELTFFYPSTEWQMTQPFRCHCGSETCLEVIQGAAYLSEDVLLRHNLNAHIRELVRQASIVPA